MATALAKVTVVGGDNGVWFDGQMLHVLMTVAIDANPATYLTGGLVMALNDPLIKAQRKPQVVYVQGIAGYEYRYVPGTDNTNGKLLVLAQTNAAAEDAPLGELTSGNAIPAACSGDTIIAEALFLGQN